MAKNNHLEIENSQIHPPKDFASADNGDVVRKNLNGELSWDNNPWKIQVIDLVDINAAPPTEVNGDRYLLIEVASTVADSGWDGAVVDDIVEFSDTNDTWGKYTPVEGDFVHDNDSNDLYKFDGTLWAIFVTPGAGDFSNGGEAGGANRTLGNTDAFALAFLTNNLQRISITSAGDVGINEQTPDTQLHLYKNNADGFGQLKIEQEGSGDPNIEFLITSVQQFNLGIDNSDNFFHIATGALSSGNNKFTIDTSGNVGIGTVSPEELLEIEASGDAKIKIDCGSSQDALLIFKEGVGDRFSVGYTNTDDGYSIINHSSSNKDFIIKRLTGRVGINQVAPDEILHVVGNVKIEGQAYEDIQATVTPGGTTQTIDWDDGNFAVLDLESASGNVTLTLSNPNAGAFYFIEIRQDSTTPRNIVWPANVKWPGGTAPTISTGANAVDTISMAYNGTDYLATFAQNFS